MIDCGAQTEWKSNKNSIRGPCNDLLHGRHDMYGEPFYEGHSDQSDFIKTCTLGQHSYHLLSPEYILLRQVLIRL